VKVNEGREEIRGKERTGEKHGNVGEARKGGLGAPRRGRALSHYIDLLINCTVEINVLASSSPNLSSNNFFFRTIGLQRNLFKTDCQGTKNVFRFAYLSVS
jgi:hypothetical protein